MFQIFNSDVFSYNSEKKNGPKNEAAFRGDRLLRLYGPTGTNASSGSLVNPIMIRLSPEMVNWRISKFLA